VTWGKPKQVAERNMLSSGVICEYICHNFNAKVVHDLALISY